MLVGGGRRRSGGHLVEGGLEGLLGHNGLSTKGGSWAIPQRNRVRLAERLLGKPRGSGRQDVNAGGQCATFQTVSERGVCGTTPADASEICPFRGLFLPTARCGDRESVGLGKRGLFRVESGGGGHIK